jgi:DNA-binding MarR family transcriptional regulator
LFVLKLLAGRPRTTQAEIARRTGLSVAMINGYMKQLCAGGLLEYRRKSARSVSYHLTESGEKELARLSHQLTAEMIRFFASAKAALLETIISRAQGLPRRVVLFGCGDLGEVALHALQSAGVQVIAVADPDSRRAGDIWCGREILTPDRLRGLAAETVIVADAPARDIHPALFDLVESGARLIRLDPFGDPAPASRELELVPAGSPA